MLKFFRIPFATSGDKAAIPDPVDVNGNVSYAEGYGFDYERQKTDPAVKYIERTKMNELFFDVTTALAELQSQGIPDFITPALNGGTAYSYAANVVVRYNGGIYVSLANANTALPTDATKWARQFWQKPISFKRFGAIGDGVADDTLAVQAALDAGAGGEVIAESGVYLCGKLRIRSGTTLVAEAYGGAILRAALSLPTTDPLFTNFNAGVGGVDVYTDTDITVRGVVFDGNGLGNRTAELVGISKARRITWQNCRIRNVRYIGLAHAGCRDVKILNNHFDTIGEPTPQPVAGPAIWFGSYGDGSKNYDVLIQGNSIDDCNEAGINAGAVRVRIIGNQIRNVKEAGIFVSSEFSDIQILGNNIEGVTKNNISSSGIECGASKVVIGGNQISDINGDCIALTDAQQVVISGNALSNPGRDSVTFPGASHVQIITTAAAPNQPRAITISGNQVFAASPNAYAFVSVGNVGSAVQDILIEGNNAFGLTFTSGLGIIFAAGKKGANVVIRNNAGCPGFDPTTGSVQNIATPGAQAITGVGFRPRTVALRSVKASPTQAVWSDTTTSQAGSIRGTYSAASAAGYRASIAGSSVQLVDPATGNNDVIGSITSLDDDGFTITFTTTNYQAWLSWVAYP